MPEPGNGLFWIEKPPGTWTIYNRSTNTQEAVSPETFWKFLEADIRKVIDKGGSYDEIQKRLQNEVFGQINGEQSMYQFRIVELVYKFADDSIKQYWPKELFQQYEELLDPAIQSSTSREYIHVSATQGTGPTLHAGTGGARVDNGNQGASSPPDKTGGDPIILFSGQFYYQVTDLAVRGRGLHFIFRRTYAHQTLYKGPLGYNWDHNYNLWLREEQEKYSDGTIRNVVYRSTGSLREDKYTQMTDATTGELFSLDNFVDANFLPPAGFFDKLTKTGGLYILETADGAKYEYNDQLKIKRIVDLNGNVMNFQYDDHQRLKRILDPVGKQYEFQYDELNRILSVHDVVGKRKAEYSYGNSGDLEEVDYWLKPDLVAGEDYRYLGPDNPFELQHNLTEILDPMGHCIVENEYGCSVGAWEYNRVVRQRSRDGEYFYDYNILYDTGIDPALDPFNLPLTSTIVRYPTGHQIEHWFNQQANVVRRVENIRDYAGLPRELVASYRYNEDGLLLQELYPDGSSTEYRYRREVYADLHGGDTSSASPEERFTFGNLVRKIQRPCKNSAEERIIITDYGYSNRANKLSYQRGPFYAGLLMNPLTNQSILEINYDYDDHCNLLRIRYPSVRQADGSTRSVAPVELYYNEYGLLTDVFVDTNHTRYVYYADLLRSGYASETIQDADGLKIRWQYQVDNVGRITRIVEPYGGLTDIEWTAFDTPRRIELPDVVPGGKRPIISCKYDRNRRLIQTIEDIVLHNGNSHPETALIKTLLYDHYGHPVEQKSGTLTNPDQRIRRRRFTPFGLKDMEIGPMGSVSILKHDERMLLSSVTRGHGTEHQSTSYRRYDSVGRLVEQINGNGYKTKIEYDGFGRQTRITDPDGNVVEKQYDAAGRVILSRLSGLHPETGIKLRWSEVEYAYDELGRMYEKVDHLSIPGGLAEDVLVKSRYYYDLLDRLVTFEDPNGFRWHYGYDALGRMISAQDPDGNERKWIFDDGAHKVDIIDKDVGIDSTGRPVSEMFKRTIEFDSQGQPTKEINSLGETIERHFDSRGLLTSIVDEAGHEVITDYDVFGKPTLKKTDVSGNLLRIQFIYNSNGQIVRVISPTGGETDWEYDSLNRITKIKYSSVEIKYTYDKQGNIVTELDQNGIRINRSYTAGGLLSREEVDMTAFIASPGAPLYRPTDTSYSEYLYTPSGKIAAGRTNETSVSLAYDSLGRIIEEKTESFAIAYQYNLVDKLTRLTLHDLRELSYEYSRSGNLQNIRQTSSGRSYPGDPESPNDRILASLNWVGQRIHSITFGNSHLGKYTYDAGRRLSSIDWIRVPDQTRIMREVHLYGSRGEWLASQKDDMLRLHKYDEIGRLVEALDRYGIRPIDVASYSPATSEEELEEVIGQSDINDLVNLIEEESAILPVRRLFRYQLENSTNRLKTERLDTDISVFSESVHYEPDNYDRYRSVGAINIIHDLAGNMLNDDDYKTYRYDAYHRLTEVNTPAGDVRISYDAFSRPVRVEAPENTKTLIFSGNDLVGWKNNGISEGQAVPMKELNLFAHFASNGIDVFPIYDSAGSLTTLVRQDGTILGRTIYDPFGQVISRDATWTLPFGFSNSIYESYSGLYLLRARSYYPRFGRFLQTDPAGFVDGTNLYSYARHAPGTLVDYLGFSSSSPDWGNHARAVSTLGTGLLAAGTALLILSGPIGWLGALAGTMLLAGGTAGVGAGIAQLATAHTRTVEQDVELTSKTATVLGAASGPGPLVGAAAAAAAGEDIEKGVAIGGLAEFAIGAGTGIKNLISRKRGIGPAASIPEDLGASWERGYFDITTQETFMVKVGGRGREAGSYGDFLFESYDEALKYANDLALQGEAEIRATRALPIIWSGEFNPSLAGRPGNPVEAVQIFRVPPKSPFITSIINRQREGAVISGSPSSYQGGASQVIIGRSAKVGPAATEIPISRP